MPILSFSVHSLSSRRLPGDGGSLQSPYTAVADDLSFEDAEEWLDNLERQGVRSRIVTLTPTGRVSVQWAG